MLCGIVPLTVDTYSCIRFRQIICAFLIIADKGDLVFQGRRILVAVVAIIHLKVNVALSAGIRRIDFCVDKISRGADHGDRFFRTRTQVISDPIGCPLCLGTYIIVSAVGINITGRYNFNLCV